MRAKKMEKTNTFRRMPTKCRRSISDSLMWRKEIARIWTSLMRLILHSKMRGNASRSTEASNH